MKPSQPVAPSELHGGPRPRAVWFGAASAVALMLAIHVIGRIGAFCCHNYRADSYLYASLGYCVARGDALYRDVWIDKPPLLMFLNAAAYRLAGLSMTRTVLIPVESAGMLLGYLVVFLLARSLYGGVAALPTTVAAVLAMNWFSVFDYTTEGFGLAENYMVALAAAAVLTYVRAYRRRCWKTFWLSGLFIGLCLTLKQTAVTVAATIGLHAIGVMLIRRERRWWRFGLAGVLGAVTAVVPFLVVFAAQGTLRKALADIAGEGYPHLQLFTAFPHMWRDIAALCVPLAWIPLGVVAWIEWRRTAAGQRGAVPSTSRQVGPASAELVLLLMWIAAEWTLVYFLPRRAYHYYVSAGMPVILLSGLFWWGLSRSTAPPIARLAGWWVSLAASLLASLPLVNELVPFSLRRYRSYDRAVDDRNLEEAIEELHTFTPGSAKYQRGGGAQQ